ncbi:MAG: S41 family peptidase [Bacteroidota bacterium]
MLVCILVLFFRYEFPLLMPHSVICYELMNPDTKLAIIVSGATVSSGEAMAISFIGKENARIFGELSCGLSTGNQQFRLSDGTYLFLTAYTMADRSRKVYGREIPVDEPAGSNADLQQQVYEWILE